MKQVLVTGGAGLIGAALCKRLLDNDYRVICLDNFITSSQENLKNIIKHPNFKFFKFDITEPLSSLDLTFSNLEYVYHLACPTGVPNLSIIPLEMLKTCSVGTENILSLAKKYNSNFVFTSTSEVYGDPLVFPQTEEYVGNVDPVGIRSPYEEGKRYAESLTMTYVRKFNLNAKIVRVFNTYGPKFASDQRVITRFINSAKVNENITVEGDGSQTRTFCYVDDQVNSLLTIADKGSAGQVYNSGSDVEISVLELANLIKYVLNSKSKIKFIPRPAHDHHRRLPDLTKLKSLGLYEGLKLTVNGEKTNSLSYSRL
jgi:nucleoside-diphosphate-sugar epimerase